MSIHAGWKRNGRAVDIDNEGAGGTSGVVLSLEEVVTGVSNVAYTIPIKVGVTNQQFSLQVDTGSSDFWIASTSCFTSSCSQTQGHLYDPSAATETNATFTISYLSGSVFGPIFWDSVTIGGYTIDDQALAAVKDVQNEPLAPNFSGILGIALPLNSIIATDVTPLTADGPDGAAWASNLFSINKAPSFHFLSLAFSRPGSDQVQSVLGIGKHPTALVPDPSLIHYSTPVADGSQTLFWKASVRAITVYVNGVASQVQLGPSITGAVFPNAILDSGTSLILTTTAIANAIYGAIGITPAANGLYYVPCTTPLNMTITLDNRSETPLHPLDLTAEPQGNQAQFCTGLIQTANSQLSNPISSKADIILGVPFMRNVYTVMAYSVPNKNGSFPAVNSSDHKDGGLSHTITPRLGLMSLTDSTKALQEFHNVRALSQPIDGESHRNTSHHHSPSMVNLGGKQMSVGIVVLIGLLSFLGLCGVLFALRWLLHRRAHRKAVARESGNGDSGMDKVAYMLTRTSRSHREKAAGLESHEGLSEDELRKTRFEAYMRKQRKMATLSTMASELTMVGGYEGTIYGGVYDDLPEGQEFGLLTLTRNIPADREPAVWDPVTELDWGDDTLTQHPPRTYEIPPEPPSPAHAHLVNERQKLISSHHRRNSSVAQHLLS